MNPTRSVRTAVLALLMSLTLLSACATPTGAGPQDPAAVARAVEKAKSGIQPYISAATEPIAWNGPETSPRPRPGLNVVIIAQMNATGASRPANAIAEAATAIGWHPTIVDNQGKADVKLAAINSAVDQHADAIFLLYVDPQLVASGVRRAQAAGIPLITYGIDHPSDLDIPDVSGDYVLQGRTVAQYLVWRNNANVNLLIEEASDEYVVAHEQGPGMRDYLGDQQNCPGCQVQTKQYVLSNFLDPTSGPAAQASATLQSNPAINSVICFDACLYQVISAIDRAGLTDRIAGAGFNCNPENLALIQQGHVQQVCWADPFEWAGYAMVDNINRITSGEAPFDYKSAIPGALFDKATLDSLPPEKVAEISQAGWNGTFDFKAKFTQLWGAQS